MTLSCRPLPERRIGIVLSALGAPVILAGAVCYVLPGPGFHLLVTGLALLITGLVMTASDRVRRG
ncbi:PGPGW domain-containing protein [Streptomyces avidinii]|uniref:PGPGW domain-containing protein n=1 Tax=Streptomyces TaxID=1883 RepID=UPI000F430643|nr:PGPGW domain-containing protein [Streptomyces sp. ADI95-16]AYV26406.1 Putative transmembrane protein (PGPGW) [Streptomyces sp. ADI95-16]